MPSLRRARIIHKSGTAASQPKPPEPQRSDGKPESKPGKIDTAREARESSAWESNLASAKFGGNVSNVIAAAAKIHLLAGDGYKH